MTAAKKQQEFITFSPKLRAADACANYWMRQATIRLRREICWCWHERGLQPVDNVAVLPPFTDKVSTTLDMSRFWAEKQNFYLTDSTARYLTEQLQIKSPCAAGNRATQGSFEWVVQRLELDDVAAFVLALALTVAFDGSMSSVIAACLNDQHKSHPTLGLAQRLWDEPEQVLRIADQFHPLFRCGLIKYSSQVGHQYAETAWDAPIAVPSLVAEQLLFPDGPYPHGLVPMPIVNTDHKLSETIRMAPLRLNTANADRLRLLPVIGEKGSSRREIVKAIAQENAKEVVEFQADPALLDDHYLNSVATVCWLKDSYLFFSKEMTKAPSSNVAKSDHYTLPSQTIPATVFLSLNERSQLAQLPANLLLPAVQVPSLTYEERVSYWKANLGGKARKLEPVIAECARRFRFEKETIRAVCEELKELRAKITQEDFVTACRAELDSDIGELASRVIPRFNNEELILPYKQQALFEEVIKAMRSLTEVHYTWGTGKVWNESGISVLFAGPPGTGKTMAAEILAIKLDLPMYRIDLSQVVNKYIGETEKNLKRVFDAADVSDMILFFDEADSLFGRRTEVSDAHDRYANLEISYLLERMERFKGLAILATNRKKDLDEAFLRRLRYIIDFPLPDLNERKKIWQQVMPAHSDSANVDFDFLAEHFQLPGGNIRSIIFNACLQSADGAALRAGGRAADLSMKKIIVAVKREYDKLNRTLSLEHYGPYATFIRGLEQEEIRHE